MSSRYPPVHDSRYAPRARSRSPHRYQEWRPPGAPNTGFSNRHPDFNRGGPEPPRGPKTFNDPIRPSGPGAGTTAPLGPRGRGAPPRPEFRELRDAPPLGTDRSFRDRDFDRRARPASPRPRSPIRNFRDAPPARDLDIGRPRRESRDGSLSMGPAYTDQPPFGQTGFGRGGFGGRGRGRGRGDFDFRDRGRRGPIDDRSTIRPRDRSPPPRWGSVSRPEREDWRPERREEDRWPDRDDRERDGERFRKEAIQPNRFDSRLTNEGPTRTPTPHQAVPPSVLPPAERTAPTEQLKEEPAVRRFSTTTSNALAKEPRREPLPPQADLMAGRAESSTAKYGSRTSSPPPSGPQVPAFGSFAIKPSVYSGPTSNVWKAPTESRPINTPRAPRAPSPIPKTAPTAPKAQLNAAPPAAPRAPRALEGGLSTFNESHNERVPAAPKSWSTAPPQPPIPTGPWALRGDDRNNNQFTQPPARDVRSLSTSYQANVPSVPVSPRMSLTPVKPLEMGPSPSGSVQSQVGGFDSGVKDSRYVRSDQGLPRSGTPPPTAPSGPRRTHSFSTSPVLHSPNIPTAPKAIRGPPVAPRAATDRNIPPSNRPPDRGQMPQSRAPLNAPRAPAWNQWIRPGAPVYRDPAIPAKRDANGEEKAMPPRAQVSPGLQSARRISEPSPFRAERVNEGFGSATTPFSPYSKTSEGTNKAKTPDAETDEPNSKVFESKPLEIEQNTFPTTEAFAEETSDDEGMELDEEDFAQSKAKYERQKAHLESQLIDLNAREYRAVTPLERLSRLARICEQDLGRVDVVSPSVEEDRSVDAMEEETEQPPEPSPLPQNGDDQQDLLTPKQEDLDEAMSDAELDDDLLPAPILSTEAIRLPYLIKSPLTPLSERGAMQETVARQHASKAAVVAHLAAQTKDEVALNGDLKHGYLRQYRQWQLELRLLDRGREEKERDDRQVSADPGPDPETSYSAIEAPIIESSRSRLHKFSSEYDIQQVLKESEEMARIEQERLDRESKKIQADLEREAPIPDVFDKMMQQRRSYRDRNRYRNAGHLTDFFGYEPPMDTFTDQEHKKFLELFKERPKKWGEIAASLPGRTYADCIHHYYANKWDGRFREKRGKHRSKNTRGRGGKAAPRTRGSALMADLSRVEEDASNPPAYTETGRPRRAATRATYGEKDSDSKNIATTSAPGKKGIATLDPAGERTAKRRKTATGERVARRGRQPLAAAPAVSPGTYDKESVPSKEDLARAQSLEEASLLTGLQAGRRVIPDTLAMFAQEDLSTPGDAGEGSRQPGQQSSQKTGPSSYWSVPEQTDFIKFISHFGTDFAGIAAHMGTKTQTMVKNHYMRLVEGGTKPELVEAADVANARRKRGENMGLPPTPTPITKRRYDNPPNFPRVMTSEGFKTLMDVDEPSTSAQSPMQVQTQGLQYPQQSRFMTPSQSTPASQQRVVSNPAQVVASPGLNKQSQPGQTRSNPPPGPKMGFFTDSKERRPTVSSMPSNRSIHQSLQQNLQMHAQQQEPPPPPTRMPSEGQIPSLEFMENLEREKARAMNIQAQALDRISQDRAPQVSPHQNLYHSMGLQHPRSVHSSLPDRRPDLEDRPATPAASAPLVSRQGQQGFFRNMIGSPALTAPSPITLNPTSFRPAPLPSPPKRDEHRPGSVPAHSPAQSVANLASGPPPPEARRSNVMSLLNIDSEEPRPSKNRISDQSNSALFSRAQSPAPQTFTAGPAASGSLPRRDVFSQTPVPRSEFERPSFAQTATHMATPPLQQQQHERLSGTGMTQGGPRQDWTARAPTSQPPLSSSPHPPTPLVPEARPYFPHHRTSVLGGLNSQNRHNPSPPPNNHPFLQHSRTPSLGQSITSAQAQPQGMQHVSHAQGTAAQAVPNAYAQSSGPVNHMQQMQQQNHMRHSHNSSLGSLGPVHANLHRRQINPEEEYFMQQQLHQQQQQQQQREREYQQRGEQMRAERIDMERQQMDRHYQAQQQQQAQQQEQQNHYAAQYRPPPQTMRQSHPQPFGSQSPGLGIREQSRREAENMHRDAMHREGQRVRDPYQSEREEEEVMRRRYEENENQRQRYEQIRDGGYQGGRLSGSGYPHNRR